MIKMELETGIVFTNYEQAYLGVTIDGNVMIWARDFAAGVKIKVLKKLKGESTQIKNIIGENVQLIETT